MALKDIVPCDHFPNAISPAALGEWFAGYSDTVETGTTIGRYGEGGIRSADGDTQIPELEWKLRLIAAGTGYNFLSFHIKVESPPDNDTILVRMYNDYSGGADNLLYLEITPSLDLVVRNRFFSVLATVNAAFPQNVWKHVEIALIVGVSNADVYVYIDGVQAVYVGSVDTLADVVTGIEYVTFSGGPGLSYVLDDLAAWDADISSAPSGFVGVKRMYTLPVVSDYVSGLGPAFVPSTGVNIFATEDDPIPGPHNSDGDFAYLLDGEFGDEHIDLFGVGSPPVTLSGIVGVLTVSEAKYTTSMSGNTINAVIYDGITLSEPEYLLDVGNYWNLSSFIGMYKAHRAWADRDPQNNLWTNVTVIGAKVGYISGVVPV